MGSRILILGAGFGGITVATELRRQLGSEHRIALVESRDYFRMGLRKLWAMVGHCGPEEGKRPLSALRADGVDLLRERVTRIDLEGRRVETDAASHPYDYLVVALGADLRPDLIPGLVEHGVDLYDDAQVPRLAAAVREFHGGRVLLAIAGAPYKCPPAPYEAAFLLDAHLRERGIRERCSLEITAPMPVALPNAGKAGSDMLLAALAERGIGLHCGQKLQRVEPGRAVYEEGERPFDLLLAVPPHRAPKVVAESGLTGDAPYITADPRTFATGQPGVYAVGDVVQVVLSNGLLLPKAGLMAELQGQRVAAAIAAELNGAPEPEPFAGRGVCWVEMGGGSAALFEGEFYAAPEPRVAIRPGAPEHLAAKRQFEAERLSRWFGQ